MTTGCGCEPNERKNMNEQDLTPADLDALPTRAVVIDDDNDAHQKVGGHWYESGIEDDPLTSAELAEQYRPIRLLWPVPEPDHSMCARPDQALVTVREGRRFPDGGRRVLVLAPSGEEIVQGSDTWAESVGLPVPEPEPTVVERAATELASVTHLTGAEATAAAEVLCERGLLVRDGEQ